MSAFHYCVAEIGHVPSLFTLLLAEGEISVNIVIIVFLGGLLSPR